MAAARAGARGKRQTTIKEPAIAANAR